MLLQTVGEVAVREQVERVLRSDCFRTSETLRRLFSYLAEKALTGEADSLKEYILGVEVFGKAEEYDPRQDASVRIQASKLRQKLEEYYRKEGAADPVVIGFPKGHFRLTFEPKTPPAPVQDVPAADAPLRRGIRRWQTACAVLAGVAATAIGFMVWRPTDTRSGAWTPEIRAIWGPMLAQDRPLIVSLGAPLFIKTRAGFFRSPITNRWDEVSKTLTVLDWLRDDLRAGTAQPVNIYTGFGDALGAFEVAKLLAGRGRDIVAKRSSAVTWEDLATHNVVFLGPPKFNLQLKDIPVKQDLVLEGSMIRNLRPQANEPTTLRGDWPPTSDHVVEDYALITRIPGLQGHGDLMILSASSTEGTAAAVQFVTRPEFAREIVQRVRSADGGFPRYYQVVIHARFKAMVPTEITYRFHHVLQPVN
jgi:hypothetical protein